MRKKSILFITQTASPVGGVETWLMNMSAFLEQQGWHVVIGLLKGACYHDPSGFMAHNPNRNYEIIEGSGKGVLERIVTVSNFIKKGAYSIVIPLVSADAHYGMCMAKLSGCRSLYMFSLHGNVPAQVYEAQRYFDFIDYCICPGKLTCRVLNQLGMDASRIKHIPHGVEVHDKAKPERSSSECLKLIYLGRLSREDKRVMDMVSLVKELDARNISYRFDVIGDGPCRAPLEDALRGNADKVVFWGYQEAAYIHDKILPSADCLVLFSESEAFGFVLLEAMSHGVVPISSKYLGAQSEGIIKHAENGLLFPIGDMPCAASQVETLANDRVLYQQMSDRAYDTVNRQYLKQHSLEQWGEVLEHALTVENSRSGDFVMLPRGLGMFQTIRWHQRMIIFLRELKRRVFGVHQSIIGGEEWPWIYQEATQEDLACMLELLRHEDYA